MRDLLKTIFRRLLHPHPQPRHRGQVRLFPQGFTIHRGAEPVRLLLWDDVESVVAFVIERGEGDQINVGFHRRGEDDHYYRVDEDMAGFTELVRTLPRHFAYNDATWMFRLVHPERAENEITLWRRSKQPQVNRAR